MAFYSANTRRGASEGLLAREELERRPKKKAKVCWRLGRRITMGHPLMPFVPCREWKDATS